MSRKLSLILLVAALTLAIAVPVLADPPPGTKPDFSPRVYADGEEWGTKVIGELKIPNDKMKVSLDKFYVVTNSNNPGTQLPVGEAAPGKGYNGGRWWVWTVEWTEAGFEDHGTVPILKSQADIDLHESLEHLMITEGSPGGPGAPPDYFLCPLLPVKE